jgi:hypothetical protein
LSFWSCGLGTATGTSYAAEGPEQLPILQHPVSHNLKWDDVDALFRHLGQIEKEPNGNMKVTRNGQIMVLHPHRTKDVSETEEVMAIRHFIERSEAVAPSLDEKEMHWLVVINHDKARIFCSEMHGAIPQRILPHEPEALFRQAQDAKNFSRGRGGETIPCADFSARARFLACRIKSSSLISSTAAVAVFFRGITSPIRSNSFKAFRFVDSPI